MLSLYRHQHPHLTDKQGKHPKHHKPPHMIGRISAVKELIDNKEVAFLILTFLLYP